MRQSSWFALSSRLALAVGSQRSLSGRQPSVFREGRIIDVLRRAALQLDEASKLPVTDFKRLGAVRKWRMGESDLAYLDLQRAFVGPEPPPSTGDVADWIGGSDFSGPPLWTTITSFDARTFAPEVPIPFFVIQGRDDRVTSYRAAKDYLDRVRAPAKAFIPIDGGHFACFTHAAQFIDSVRTRMKPRVHLVATPPM